MEKSFLRRLREINIERCETHHPLRAWDCLQWAGALAGEVGELANLCKKISRVQVSNLFTESTITEWQISDEIADVLIYLYLLAAYFDIDIEWAVKHKFNKDSEDTSKFNFSKRLD